MVSPEKSGDFVLSLEREKGGGLLGTGKNKGCFETVPVPVFCRHGITDDPEQGAGNRGEEDK